MTALGIPLDFILCGLILVGLAVFHHHMLRVAVPGLLIVTACKLAFGDFSGTQVTAGLLQLPGHESVTFANLFVPLLGFALLAEHFEKSGVPAILPDYLPDGWMGGFTKLVLVCVMSSYLDNIAAAMVGGTMVAVMYQRWVHIGFAAAGVAASNAGCGGSVAARQQHACRPIMRDIPAGVRVVWQRLGVVAAILALAVSANVYFNLSSPATPDHWPVASWLSTLDQGFLRPVVHSNPSTALALRHSGYDGGYWLTQSVLATA